ncbi:DUF4167 domain-containing protein [Chelativorans sp.]|uniref:DUF4167 domain-containing protein n=1 Tax=Chelativorans sp. TaxID=2203393 RepID=UPI00281281C6|nr:DUF4167 domain-containing protein [Chelativorans sp.]
MRPQQQNRRMRGRGNNNNNNNNNRKGPNPLTRSYESNGPDVKIRGTAQQIAEKYTTLARDAQSSGDRVMAENYLQHAEHYNRLIAAAQAQMQPQQQQQNTRDFRDESEEDGEERDEQDAFFPGHPRPAVNDGSGPQPVIDGLPAEVALKDREVNGAGRPNGRGHGGNGAHRPVNGQPDGQAERLEQAVAPAAVEAAAVATETPQKEAGETPGAKPARRTRRPRAKKADDAQDEAASPEDVVAQG